LEVPKALEIVNHYGAAIASEEVAVRRLSLLPSNKETIVKAFKISTAYRIEFDTLTDELENALTASLGHLSAFIPDEEANEANATLKAVKEKKIATDDPKVQKALNLLTQVMYDPELADEFKHFINVVRSLDRDDPLFRQRVYTLAGVEYPPPRKKSFWASLFG
jgi:hypothetical protein